MRHAITALVALAGFCACPVAHGQIAEVRVDFGKVTEAALSNGEQKVLLRNESDRPVIVDKVTAGCGCVQVDWSSSRSISPGETIETTARLDPEAIRPGAFSYPILAEVAGTQKQIGDVRFEYDPSVVPSQRTFWLQSIDGLTHLRADIGIMTGAETNVEDVVVLAPPYVSIQLTPLDRTRGQIELTYQADVPLRERRFEVLLKDPKSSDAPVRLTVHVPALDLVALDPGAVLFPNVKTGMPAALSVRLRPLTSQSLEIGSIEVVSDDDQLQGELREANGELWLDVSVRPSEPGVASATLVLRDRSRTWSIPISTTWRAHE